MNITIDGKKLSANKGEMILQVARRAGIDIPTLCHHEALEPVGACRLCIVEITHHKWNGWKGIVASCLYPVEDGLEVFTKSERIIRQRQTIIALLLARCPEAVELQELADAYGGVVQYKPFADGSKCIMCYLCTRACEAVGPEAISTVNRGTFKEIAPPFHKEAISCVGCGTCAQICPTGHIQMEDTKDQRKIWGRVFNFAKCERCGASMITEDYRDYAIENRGLPADYYNLCAACKRKEHADKFSKVGLIQPLGE